MSAGSNHITENILRVLFPRTCPGCGELIETNEAICPVCLRLLPRSEEVALRHNLTEDLFCSDPRFVRGASFTLFTHDAPIRKFIHQMKYNERPDIACQLTREAAADFMQSDFFDGIDVIIPIPLHPRRYRLRGYNQSEYIARTLGKQTGIAVEVTHITRCVNNPQQARTGGRDRATNVKGIFTVNHPEEMYHKHILLVDDVITTGSTIRSCMQAMTPFRGCKISVFALGKAR